MNYSDMTRPSLECAKPTPELIREVSKRVYLAQGNECSHDNTYEDDEQITGIDSETGETIWLRQIQYIDVCKDCGKRGVYVPDITDPAVFWPLAWENNILIVKAKGLAGYLDNAMLHNLVCTFTQKEFNFSVAIVPDENPGVAVGLAFLRIEEEK